ncbi:MAG: OmpH family outer membrane protein [Alphaproteobacteria bacterium]
MMKTTMKKVLMTLGLASMVTMATAAQAELKVAVLDVVQVVNASSANQKAEQALTKQRDDAQGKINKLEAPLLEKQKKLEERKSVISQEQYLEEQGQLRKDIRQFKAEAQTLQEGLQREALRRRKEIIETVNGIVTTMAKARGYDVVVPKNVVLFSSDAIDISKEVLDEVNKKLK